MLIQALPDQRLDDGLTADVELRGSAIQFFQHGSGEVHVDTLNRLNHTALTPEETGDVPPLIG